VKFLSLHDSVTQCPYLEGRVFTAENFIAPMLSADEIDALLKTGFRHFGSYYFRPVCEGCRRCVPIRVDVRRHQPTRSENRVLRTNRDLVTTVGAPAPDSRAYSLYRMHQHRFEERASSSYEQFVKSFFTPTFGNTQLSVYLDDLLVSVLHLDVTGTSLSAIYCYYDTGCFRRSLGTFSILAGLQFAKELGVSRYYLGYIVEGNHHMEYKSRYRPNEVLTAGGWLPFKSCSGHMENSAKYAEGFPGAEYRSTRPFVRVLLDD
jgi:leucyl-tRNA---protein transferase